VGLVADRTGKISDAESAQQLPPMAATSSVFIEHSMCPERNPVYPSRVFVPCFARC